MKFQSIAMVFVLMTTAAHSAWSPIDAHFDELKSSVCSYLNTSWVSQEKAHWIMDLIVMTQPKVCVDVGTFIGSSALPMAVALKYLGNGKVYLIDAWSNQEAIKGISMEDPNYCWWSTLDMQGIKEQCLSMIRQWALESYCQVIHADSYQAAQQIGQIDFLHLDGNFSKEGSLLDAMTYLPKVKSGGYILLSNAFVTVDHISTKIDTVWFLYYECELVLELENSNVLLFRKQ